jgi:hypothetical protein
LLLATHDPSGRCARVVTRLHAMLEARAFVVDRIALEEGTPPPDLAPYKGVVLGFADPAWLGVRAGSVPPVVGAFVDETPDLDERKVALFSVHRLRPSDALGQLAARVERRGAQVVVTHSYDGWAPQRAEHVVPAECMVRIR